jgi:hypothetical protein
MRSRNHPSSDTPPASAEPTPAESTPPEPPPVIDSDAPVCVLCGKPENILVAPLMRTHDGRLLHRACYGEEHQP